MKTLFDRWAELEPGDTMTVSEDEFWTLMQYSYPQAITGTSTIIGRHGITCMAGNHIVSHRAYRE